MVNKEKNTFSTNEDFASLLEEYSNKKQLQKCVVPAVVVGFDDTDVLVDVGLKSEGRINKAECDPNVKMGDTFDVYVERYEDKNGSVVVSREKARREEVWGDLEKIMVSGEHITGSITGRVRGGYTVLLKGTTAFLPGSQIDVRPIRDITPLMGIEQPFLILKMDKLRGNIVVSRRAILEESRAEQRSEIIKNLSEGQIVEGVVKNITDYGAFIDLGGVDGLLHVTDISWKRINNPAEVLTVGQTIKVQIIKFSSDTGRISLGMKQLEANPWAGVDTRYAVGTVCKGKVSNITEYGIFVELESGIEGLVHVSEMSWTKKNIHPSKLVALSQDVDVIVLDVDESKRRISLGMKQIQENPWAAFAKNHQIGDIIEGEVKNIMEFGIFVGVADELDGMVHTSDLSWTKPGDEALKDYTKGQMVKAKILDIDVEKERISLGIKELTEDPYAGKEDTLKKGQIVTAVVTGIQEDGIEVEVEGISSFIKKADLAKERNEQRSDRFAVGEKVDAKITAYTASTHALSLSIKAKEVDEHKAALKEFGNADSGASLGDILGAVLGKKKKAETEEPKKKTTKTEKAEKTETTEDNADEAAPKKRGRKKKEEA